MEFIGVDAECLADAADLLKQLLQTKNLELIGLDVMEVEVYFLNAELKSGKQDQTIKIIDDFLGKML